ncbi:MAG: ATP-binding cassette domain-containing protein [Xanthomonadaceae bacterium]|nr:ATP-binding cassette domain-containing protein [Xanthomonadaceae bacterium]
MITLIQLQDGAKAFGSKQLFEKATFAVNEGEHIGVIGPNGAGKTTLFKILIGQEVLDDGRIVKSKELRLGYLSQHDHWKPETTVEDYLTENAVMPIWDLKALGLGLGVTEDMYSRPVLSFSGGYRMRFKLLYLIGQEPNLMLLDEPTNYLDLETLIVLENFLQGFRGAFLLISHDREFLRRTTDHIVEVESGDVIKYNGNIDDYFEQKELLRTQLEARAMSIADKRKQVLDFVARFGAKASKASQAQSRLKSLDRMETIEIKPLAVGARIPIPPPIRTGKLITGLESVTMGYPTKTVVENVNFQIMSVDHVAVVGLNGAGKTTFLKTLAGELETLSGKVTHGYQVTFGYYAQHVAERLNPSHTVAQAMASIAHPSVLPLDVLNLAGALLFSGDSVKKPVSILSGGEKARVALGQILLQKASCLILDEPTNHLDFQTVEALTQSLKEYPGTVIVVSHDRSFISRIGNKILEIKHGHMHLYHGTYDEYVWKLQKDILNPSKAESKGSKSKAVVTAEIESPKDHAIARELKKQNEKELKRLERRGKELETAIQKTQELIQALNQKMSEDSSFINREKIEELRKLGVTLERDESEWLEINEKIESLKT